MAAGLVAQRNRSVAGNPSQRIVLRRNIVKRKQADLCTGQFGSFEKHWIPIADSQQTFVHAGCDFWGSNENQSGPQSFFELRANEHKVQLFSGVK